MKADGFLSKQSLFVHPLNDKGEKATPADCVRYAYRWTMELWKLARHDGEAQKLLRGLSGEVVGLARTRLDDNPIFTRVADPFLEAYEGGKRLTQSDVFCQDWLWQGLLHADGIKLSPEGYKIRKPGEMAKLAIAALEDALGNDWQGHGDVTRFFDTNHNYKTPLSRRTWATMDRGERRELVRKEAHINYEPTRGSKGSYPFRV